MKSSKRAGCWSALSLLLLLHLFTFRVLGESTAFAIDYWQTSACPQLCSAAGPDPSRWRYYHDANALQKCDETTIFQMNLYNSVADPKTHVLYRACTASQTVASPRSPLQRRQFLSLNSSAPTEVQAPINVASWGTSTSSSYYPSVSTAITQLAGYLQENSNFSTSLFARSGNVVAGIYVGEQIDPSSVPGIAQKVIQHISSGILEREAAQVCQVSNHSTGSQFLGIIYDTSGNLSAVQSALKTWHSASCITGDSESVDLGVVSINLIPGNSISIGPDSKHGALSVRSEIAERSTCSYIQIQPGDECYTLAQSCGITLDEFESYNGGSSICNDLPVGQYVCCSPGSLPDFSPQPYSNGTCYTYTVQSGDTCDAIAASYKMKTSVIENVNNNTWGWMGCGDLLIGMSICLSTGNPPYPTNVPNAVCGPQVNNTVFPSDYTEWPGLNPCPLNACCDIWGQCGITSEFCTPSLSATGAPGTALPGSNGCISNCGTEIVASSPPASFARMGYFESFNDQRSCLHMSPSDIPNYYTHVLFAFANITDDYDVSIEGAADMFQEFIATEGFDRIVSFGGWAFSTDPSTAPIFRQGVTSTNRVVFAANVANFVQSNDLQGVNFDWEYPGPSIIPGVPSGSPEDGENYLEFLREVRSVLPTEYSISITAPAAYYYLQNFPIYNMSKIVDFIVYMTYDLHGQWDYGNTWTDPGCPGGNCLRSQINMTETQQAFSMITKAGVPANMIMVGLPLYGRSFQMSAAGCYSEMCTYTGPESGAIPGSCTNTAGYISNWEINQIMSNSEWSSTVEEYFTEEAGDILVYDSTQWVSWMKPSTYDERSAWAQGLNFGGVSDWAIDLNASFTDNGTEIGEGSGVVYIDPEIYNMPSPTIACLPPCTFVLPPWTLNTTTTIFVPPTTIVVQDTWPSVSTDANGVTTSYYVTSTTTTTITPPPITTDIINVWNVQWIDPTPTVIYPTSSIVGPPFPLTEPPLTQPSTTLPGTTYIYSPGPYPSVSTSTGPPGPPPPGYSKAAISVVSGSPSPTPTPGKPGVGGLCKKNCDPDGPLPPEHPPCIGLGCAGGGHCIGDGCSANDKAGGGPDGGGEGTTTTTTTCATSSKVTDCAVACSVTNYGDASFASNCYTTACSTVFACQTAGSTSTTETTTAVCTLSTSISTWIPVTGAPMPYLGSDNTWTTPGATTTTSSTSSTSTSTGGGNGGGSPTTTTSIPWPTNTAINEGPGYCFTSDMGYSSFALDQAQNAVKSFCQNEYVLDPGNTYGFVEETTDDPPVIVTAGWAADQSGCGSKESWSFAGSTEQYDFCLDAWSTDYFCENEDAAAATSYGGGYVYNSGDGCILLKLYAKIAQQGPLIANSTATTAGKNGTAWSSNSTQSHWSVSNDSSIAHQAQLFG